MANAFSDSKIAEKFKTVSLSHQTLSRRASEMADNVSDTLRCVMNDGEYYRLGLDESTRMFANLYLSAQLTRMLKSRKIS
jgi:hypothetical protein